jgi:ribosomal protein L12E/L44/L45/RPP1/RPP2
MRERDGWSTAKEVSRLLLIAMLVSAAIGVLAPFTVTSPVQASVLADKKDEKEKNDQKDKKNQDDDRGEDFVLNGQVLEIDTSKDPPEMVVGTVDGRAIVRVLKTDEIVINGVGVGDYVELTGEKINELLFEATQISVGQRFAGPRPESSAQSEAEDSEAEDDAGHDDADE